LNKNKIKRKSINIVIKTKRKRRGSRRRRRCGEYVSQTHRSTQSGPERIIEESQENKEKCNQINIVGSSVEGNMVLAKKKKKIAINSKEQESTQSGSQSN